MEADTKQPSSPMDATPGPQHEWLRQLEGDWVHETAVPPAPGQAADTLTGTESVRFLGNIWLVAEGRGQMPGGGEAWTLMTLGYDPGKGRFVGSWHGSMMQHLWVYDGQLDDAERVLTLSSVGPDFETPGQTRRYQDVIEIQDADHRTLTGRMLDDEGEWQELMRVSYRRVPG
jgi:hypothetical protein